MVGANNAAVYSIHGWVRDLPRMIGERYGHACGYYLNENHNNVNINY